MRLKDEPLQKVWWEYYGDWSFFDRDPADGNLKICLTEKDDRADWTPTIAEMAMGRLEYPPKYRSYLTYYQRDPYYHNHATVFTGRIGDWREVHNHRIYAYCNEFEGTLGYDETVSQLGSDEPVARHHAPDNIKPLRLAVLCGESPPGVWYPYPPHWEPDAWFKERIRIGQDEMQYLYGLTLMHEPGSAGALGM
jgi:hypothetical protein